jgi:hypothetical protein
MSALSIQPTYPIFTDIDGQPLEAGYVWIGTANLDPQTNPITVYWDAALTILAPQPIRTLAGYPSNNGTPARLYVNSDYSIRVMNRNGSTVYSAPSATERYSDIVVSGVDAKNVVYTAPLLNAVQTTQEEFNSRYISVKDFGAVGDGVADDTAAIQSAIDNFNTPGCLFFPNGTYKISAPILVNQRLWIKGEASWGTTIKNTGTGDALQFTVTWYQRISTIRIEGNAGSNDGIRLETSHFLMEDVWCVDNGRHGLFVRPDTYILSANNCTFFQNNGDGVNAVASGFSGQVNDMQFMNCGFWFNNVGLRINAIAASVQGSFFESNTTHGLYIDATAFQAIGPFVIENNYFEVNISGQVYIHTDVGSAQNITISGNYFYVATGAPGASHILAKRETGGEYIRGITITSDNYYLSNTGIPHVDLADALQPKYGRQIIQTTASGDTADWTFFYKNIGYAPIETYQRRTSVFGRTGSAGAWTYPDTLYSSNIISLGAGPHTQQYELPLTSGNVYLQSGIYVDTDSTDFDLTLQISAIQSSNATLRAITFQAFTGLSGSGLRQILDISDLTSVNSGRVLPGEKIILFVTIENNDGPATTLRVSNPFVRYME